MRIRWIAAALFVLAGGLAADTGDLGRIDFPTSGSPAAQERFVRGVLLLHSFEYDDAAEEFRAAQAAEPGFAMAYWGEAMTATHPIWLQRDAAKARLVLAKLGATRDARRAKAPTPRELAYLDAVETLYEEGEKHDRELAYCAAMQRLHESFPDDLEAESFYALALLGTSQPDRDFAVYMKAAALAEEVFAKNPLHPGAVHYLIHSYDDPVHAPLGLRPARVYAKIAPAAAHALHMPSHIFLASGMWDDVVASNEASWAAADARVRRKSLGVDERNFHALQWLLYARLQQGRFVEARRLLAVMEEDAKKSGSDRALGSLSTMRAAYAVETGCAKDSPAIDGKAPRDLFLSGFCAWKRGDAGGIASALSSLTGEAGAAASGAGEGHAHGGGMGGYGLGGSASVAAVMRQQLEALSLLQKGRTAAALARAKDAAAAEDALRFEFGPPLVIKPAHELLGELLAAQGRPADAQKEFESALSHAPGRSLSLAGLVRAASAAKNAPAAEAALERLEANRREADPPRPGFSPAGEVR
ncbi:MAG: tetratricopeptide repeat protein [Thermoanaerobaculia bacterium]